MTKSLQHFIQILLIQSIVSLSAVIGIHWDHSVHLDDDYRLLWSISRPQTITPLQLQQLQQNHQHHQHQQQQQQQHQHHQRYHLHHALEVTFEIQVRTLGYVGFGFSWDGKPSGADIVIGWVDNGQTYFQVSFCWTFMMNYFSLNTVDSLIGVNSGIIKKKSSRFLVVYMPQLEMDLNFIWKLSFFYRFIRLTFKFCNVRYNFTIKKFECK